MKGVPGDNLRCRCLSYRFLYLARWIPLLETIDSDRSPLFSIISYWKNGYYREIEKLHIHLYQVQFTGEVLENWHYMCQMLTFWWKKKSTPKILQLRKKIFLCRNTDMWSHGSDRSLLQASNPLFRAKFVPGLYIPWLIQVSSVGDPGNVSWDLLGDKKSQKMIQPCSQHESDKLGSMKYLREPHFCEVSKWHTYKRSIYSFDRVLAN